MRVGVRWRPFNLREILVEQVNTAFAKNPVRLNYNWRDIARAAWAFLSRGGRPIPSIPICWRSRVGVVAAEENEG
jgi:hypothetical protein